MPGEMAQANAPSMWLMKPCDQLGLNKREAKDFVHAKVTADEPLP